MKKCFVIMPFSGTTAERTEKYWTDHYRNFLKPQIERVGRLRLTGSDQANELILQDNGSKRWANLGLRRAFLLGKRAL